MVVLLHILKCDFILKIFNVSTFCNIFTNRYKKDSAKIWQSAGQNNGNTFNFRRFVVYLPEY